ncbi:family 78 glycoside hydrolase catalytic domain [Mucilaginibacter sp. cycad4]|uniref:family 78 glycoside hydrolase catalytic domain n=1 Tax=Mucilaginibacter sp. cycad4 TaxID=3342096 RepID=UPI002AAAF6EF|nr:family 78 glycoside hydrolase catalytic domain [Mucilaginibacter gossypii]WPV02020.1 family 78 glycoside hydrolase catalytic domain [Mucilaginibacter gossypii]
MLIEHMANPIGVATVKPRFSWQLVSDKRNLLQTAYEIRVANDSSALFLGKALVWNSGRVFSDSSINVSFKGRSLQSGRRYYWQVRVWGNSGKVSDWSTPAFFQMAFLNSSDWKAKWIAPGFTEDSLRASPLFRKQFNSPRKIKSATAYITAHGLYEAQINGKRIGDAYLTPGWTSYHKRLQYQVYDVTDKVIQGENAIGITLGSGWYRSHMSWDNIPDSYGKDIALLFQLNILYDDGTTEQIISDESWKSSTAEIRYSEIYNGETIDSRKEKKGWNMAEFNDNDWSGVKVSRNAMNILVATVNEPVKKHETFKPVKILTTPKGEKVIDFGQNLVGWVVVKASGRNGDTIKINHAEVLDKLGNFYTTNLRSAKSENNYVLKGGGEQTFEPHFSWQGFRYIKISGYTGQLIPENFTAVALYSDMEPTGTFTTSNPLINQLQRNIEWGQKGNFLDVPTDCPQRDERLGWTGDAQVFSRTAFFLRNGNNFFAKWLKDLAADQSPNGKVPDVIPNVLNYPNGGATGWSDASTIIPWNLYLAYGDKRLLKEQYPSMKAWVRFMTDSSRNYIWANGFHYGDWLSYMLDNDLYGRSAVTDKYLIAQCFYAHSTQLLINTAKVLGKTKDVTDYQKLLVHIKDAFMREYVTGNGRLVSGTQTAYVLALNFDMLPIHLRKQAADRLVKNIRSYGNHITTGFLGTPYICQVLSRFGKTNVAYDLLLQESFPSWLYPVKMGATTIWERWNGIRPDGTFEPASMNSFNHYAYGAIGDWMYSQMVGLDIDENGPGYKKIKIQPHIGGNLTYATATHITPYGKLSSGWKVENGKLIIDSEIPANTTATIYIPANRADAVTEAGKSITKSKDIRVGKLRNGYLELQVGSGRYIFCGEWPLNTKKESR